MNSPLAGFTAFASSPFSALARRFRPLARPAAVLGAALLFSTAPVHAGANLTSATFHFDDNTGNISEPIYIMFGNGPGLAAFNITYNSTSTPNITTTLARNGAGLSDPILLANVTGGNFTINLADSTVAYISYGAPLTNSATPTSASTGGGNYLTRFAPVEFTFNSTSGNYGGDTTAINYFGAAIGITNHNAANTTTDGFSGFSPNITSTEVFNRLYTAINNAGAATFNPPVSNAASPASIVMSNNSTTGTFVRITGTNSFPPPPTYPIGPYPSYGNYMATLQSNGQNTTIASNPDPAHGYQVGTWRYTYNFTANVTSGNNFVLIGNVVAQDLHSSANLTVNNLQITLPDDSQGEMSFLAYQSSYPFPTNVLFGNTTDSGNSTGGVDWADIDNTQPGAGVFSNLAQTIVGDLAEGINAGILGSNLTYLGMPIGNLSSYQWWGFPNPGDLYGNIALSGNDYNVYSGALRAQNSDGTYGIIYGSPYDDRFSNPNPLIGIDGLWTINLNPDGDLLIGSPVPEPATYALLFSSAALLVAVGKRRRSQTASRKLPALSSSPPLQPSARNAPARRLRA